MAAENEGHYLLDRDAAESNRLDEQHTLLTELAGGSLIHPRIKTGNLHAVADIATGTGIWLKHICKLLKDTPTSRPRYFHGFDISDSQFPREHAGIHFTVQDITRPFSAAHLNRYDLVHVRLLFCGLKQSEYEIAVANLMTLLKPGGFLQWEEIDYHALTQLNQESPRFFEIMKIVDDGLISAQYSNSAPQLLKQTFKRKGLVKITSHDFISSEHPQAAETMQKWLHNALRMLIPWALEASKKAKGADSSDRISPNEVIEEMSTIFASGLVPRGELLKYVHSNGENLPLLFNLISKHIGCEINDLRFLDDPVKALNEFLMHRIFLNVEIPVFLVREFDHKSVCNTILSGATKS